MNAHECLPTVIYIYSKQMIITFSIRTCTKLLTSTLVGFLCYLDGQVAVVLVKQLQKVHVPRFYDDDCHISIQSLTLTFVCTC